jgi:hypothetical protein
MRVARIIRDEELANLVATATRLRSDHAVSPHVMQALLRYNLSVLDEQIDLLYDQLGSDGPLTATLLGWSGEQVPDRVRDSWSSLNYLLSARETLASVLRSVDGYPA